MTKYLVIIEKTATGFSAYVPDLPGVVATADNRDLVETNLYEAIRFHVEGLLEDGIEIPEARSESEMMVFA